MVALLHFSSCRNDDSTNISRSNNQYLASFSWRDDKKSKVIAHGGYRGALCARFVGVATRVSHVCQPAVVGSRGERGISGRYRAVRVLIEACCIHIAGLVARRVARSERNP